jgi:agmatinase
VFDPGAPALAGGVYGLPHTPEEARVVLIPVPWEPTTSYARGTARGPSAILTASRQVDLFDQATGRVYEAGIAMLPVDPDVAAWNTEACAAAEPILASGGVTDGDPDLEARLSRVNELSDKLNDRVAALARTWMDRGKLVGVVGGDHASPFGSIAAHAARWPGLGVLHLDAHADLREAYEGFTFSHASIMHNVATRVPDVARIVQIGIRDLSEDEHAQIQTSGGRIVTFFDAWVARRLHECEVAPGPDGDEWDGNVGARLLYKMIGFALKSSQG